MGTALARGQLTSRKSLLSTHKEEDWLRTVRGEVGQYHTSPAHSLVRLLALSLQPRSRIAPCSWAHLC